jgi:hypothetical protein
MELCRARLRRVVFATNFLVVVWERPLPFRAAFVRGLATAFRVVLTTFLVVFLRSALPISASRGSLFGFFHVLRAGRHDLRARI